MRGNAITLKALGDLEIKEQDRNTAEDFLLESLKLFHKMNDQRGEGVTLHSLGMLALEQNNSFTAQNYFDQSLSLLHRVQDRQSRGIVLYTLALLAEMQENLDKAEESYRESLEIAIKVKAVNSLRISQEAYRGFLLKRYGGTIFLGAARDYKDVGGP